MRLGKYMSKKSRQSALHAYKNLLCSLVLSTLFVTQITYAEDITILIRDDVYIDYKNFLGDRDVMAVTSFGGKTIRRDVVDMIIAQQALRLGGFEHKFSYLTGKVNFRNTQLLQKGDLLISFDTYWLNDANVLKDQLYISDEVIRKGEYIAGLYTSPNNEKALAVNSLEDLSSLTSVSTPRWITDWETLSALPLKKLSIEHEWLSMARMVDIRWIDFLLMPFHSSPDQSFTMNKVKLIPIPGIAIALNDSRHFVISKKHPLGKEAIKAIDIGIKKLRENKAIVKAYTEARFFVDRKKIRILNE
jgi:hypothetical protein